MNRTTEIPMRAMPWLALLLLAMAACGSDAPAPPPAQPPKVSGPLKEPDPVDDSVKLDAQQRTDAQRAMEAAKTAQEARAARDSYTGTKHATSLDVALERKLQQLDFADFNAAKAAVLKTTTPRESIAAGKQYVGERYRADLDKITWDHMEALVKKNPALASELPPKPTQPLPTTSGDVLAAIAASTTEGQVKGIVEAYQGPLSADELKPAVEMWRWSGAVAVRELSGLEAKLVDRVVWPSANKIVVLGNSRVVTYDPSTGKETRKYEHRGVKSISSNGRWCLVQTEPGKAVIIDLETGTQHCELQAPLDSVGALDVTQDHGIAAVGGPNSTVFLFDLPGGTLRKELPDNRGIDGIDVSPDGKFVIASGARIRVWNVESGKLGWQLGSNQSRARPRAFSGDGESVYISEFSGPPESATLRLVELATGKELKTFAVGTQGSLAASISPDCSLLVDGAKGETGTLICRVRRMATGETLGTLAYDQAGGMRAFSPDGRRFVALGSSGGPFRIFGRPD